MLCCFSLASDGLSEKLAVIQICVSPQVTHGSSLAAFKTLPLVFRNLITLSWCLSSGSTADTTDAAAYTADV